MSIPIGLSELEGKPVLGENLLSGTMAQSAGESAQVGDSDAQALQSHGETGTGQAQGQATEQEPAPPQRKLVPRVKPVTVQRIGRRDLHRMICETHGMEQRPADEAIDAVLGTISDWITAMIGALEPNQRASLSIGNWGTLALTFTPKGDDKQWRINAGLPPPAQAMTMTFRPARPQSRAMRQAERRIRRLDWNTHLLHTPPHWPSLWGWSVIKVTTELRTVGLPYPEQAINHARLRPYPPLPPNSQLSA